VAPPVIPQPVDGAAAVDALLEEARAGLDRVAPEDLVAEAAAGALVVDTRPVEQRHRDGELPGAVVVDRNVLEWRLDPTCPYRLGLTEDPDRRVVLVCNEGYSSSLAAATLQQLGLRRATDLVGGFQALLVHGMPTQPLGTPDLPTTERTPTWPPARPASTTSPSTSSPFSTTP
jgi:rhodanese-related sulfurtransferase